MCLNSLIGLIKLLLILIIFVIDLQLPAGIAAGTSYALVVLFTLRSENNLNTILVAIAGIVFTVAGYFLSPPLVGTPDAAIINRALAIFLITASAILVMRNHRDRESIRSLSVLSTTDRLTNAKNRLAFDEALYTEIFRANRYQRPLSLVLLDIDHFKIINDRHGHDTGDQVLIELVRRITRITRSSDKLYRLGGDEFALLLAETQLQTAQLIGEKIGSAFDGHPLPKSSLTITLSIGIADYLDNDDPQTLFKKADEALYLSKSGGRNQTTCWRSPELNHSSV